MDPPRGSHQLHDHRCGSRNGTFVNGEEVHGDPKALPVGAQLRLGLVEFRFVDGFGLHLALRSAPAEAGIR